MNTAFVGLGWSALLLRHGASKRAVDGGVGHFAGGDAGDGDFALDVLTPPAAVDGDVGFSRMGWVMRRVLLVPVAVRLVNVLALGAIFHRFALCREVLGSGTGIPVSNMEALFGVSTLTFRVTDFVSTARDIDPCGTASLFTLKVGSPGAVL